MLKKILVANRGEIAVRVIRECQDNGIPAVAVYSEADRDSLHTLIADEAVCIGPGNPTESYLNMNNILQAALSTGCDGIHPGFGLLSENAKFADLCKENNIKFIGPDGDTISKMGDKSTARQMMMAAGVPVVPGSDGSVESTEEALRIAEEIGYPVLVKASAGGGGRGMRRADSSEELPEAMKQARMEAEAAFGDGTVYLEKLILNPRHIEVQVLADQQHHVIHLGERNCSIQRRNQKMLEEAPAFGLRSETRTKICQAAVLAAKCCDYEGAGTVEFVMDSQEHFYFIEMNTRIQVEHPVTEMVTGINIVGEQIRIASGIPLRYTQEDVKIKGHALECRICCEDPLNNFSPCPGKVDFVHFPSGFGTRVESALYSGAVISPYYDSMVAKVITLGENRVEAVRRMRRALGETVIEGPKTTQPLMQMILYNRKFLRGNYNTGFIGEELPELTNLVQTAGMIKE